MRIHMKAALLSAFILPGLGQLQKGDRIKGGVIILLVNLFLLAALFILMGQLGPVILSAKFSGTMDAAKVLEQIHGKASGAKWLLAGFLGLWLYAFIDAAVGPKGDKGPQSRQ